MEQNNYSQLVEKIDAYIRKYYLNLLIKGLLLSAGLLLAFFLIVSLLESYAYLNTLWRGIFFYSYLAFTLTILSIWIFIPLLKMWKISKGLDRKQAARQIGAFFPDLDDKLLNTLQLKEMTSADGVNNKLLQAVVDQRSEQLSVFPFSKAVQFSSNRRFIPFVLPVLSVFIILLFAAPNLIREPAERIFYYDQHYEPEAPFSFEVLNKSLSLIENNDFTLEMQTKGEEVPAVVFLHMDGQQLRMKKKDVNRFYFELKNVRKSKDFFFHAEDFSSKDYQLEVIPRPSVLNFEIEASYPSYTGKGKETFRNIGDLMVPEGTVLNWKLETKDALQVNFIHKQSSTQLEPTRNNYFEYEQQLREDMEYAISGSNQRVEGLDTLFYRIQVVKDAYPMIRINEYRDSLQRKHIYAKGFIKDDYGFRQLQLKYRVFHPDREGEAPAFSTKALPLEANNTQQQFFHFLDLDEFSLKAGEQIQYFFEIWDNDRINGSKSSRSQMMIFKAPDLNELIEERNESSENLKDKMKSAQDKARKIEKEIQRLQKELAQKKKVDWSDKEKLKNVLKKNQELLQELEEIKKENQNKIDKEKEFKEMDESIMEKQKELQELMEKLLTPEMKKMMEEMQKMMEEQMKKEDMEKMLDKLDMENEDIEKQLERDLELFKEMDFQMKMQDAIEKLDTLQKQQEALQEQTEERNADKEELSEKQEELKKEFEDFQEKLEDMKEANEKLEEPHDLESTEQEEQDIKQQMQDAQDKLDQGKQKKASQSQKNASQKMQELKEKMEQMQSDMEMEETGEDMQMLREILDNLVETSFRQEALMKELRVTSKDDPRYPELIQEQKKLRNDMEGVEDSLMALSKRQAQIEPYINKEIASINRAMDNTLAELQEMNTIGYVNPRKKNQVVSSQQQIMTSVNQLALMLSEALDQMQQQMAKQQAKPGSSCKNPKPGKSGKPSASSIKKMQQQLKKQMEKMKKDMQNGKQKGKKGKNGQEGKSGEKMSEEMAKLAAQQEMIRRKLQQYQEQLKKEGQGDAAKALNKIAEQMEENETDLVNKMLTAESLKRQEEILSRLLEAEKAERERGEKEERKSKEAKNLQKRNLDEFRSYKELKSKEVELLQTIPLYLKPYYKSFVKRYFEEYLKNN